jgi:hypothetical protein
MEARSNKILFCLLVVFVAMATSSAESFSQDIRFRETEQYVNMAKGRAYTFNTAPIKSSAAKRDTTFNIQKVE